MARIVELGLFVKQSNNNKISLRIRLKEGTSVIQEDNMMNVQGVWKPDKQLPRSGASAILEAIKDLSHPLFIVDINGIVGVAQDGLATIGPFDSVPSEAYPLLGWSPTLTLESLGDPGFRADSHRG